jgi:hypothetical protein
VSEKHKFHENRLNDNHTLLIGVNEFVPSLSTFLDRLDEIGNRRFSSNAVEQLRVPWKLVL